MDRYGNLRNITSVACNAAIDNILQDFKNEFLSGDLEKLAINDWIILLTKSNEDYKKSVQVRTDDKQKYTAGETLITRITAIKTYRKTMNGLEYLSEWGEDNIQKISERFIISINMLIREIKPILKSRMTRRKNTGLLSKNPVPGQMETPESEKELTEILNPPM